MQKDITPKPMEPFTLEEEGALVDKLDALSAASLQSYIASARAALESKALAATWRPRIEFGARHAEQALTKAQAATARDAMAPSLAMPVVASKSRKAAAPVADEESEHTVDEGWLGKATLTVTTRPSPPRRPQAT
jgi:hypothetical protein